MMEQVHNVLDTQHIRSLDYELPMPGPAPRARRASIRRRCRCAISKHGWSPPGPMRC
jgi:hypothetical protein